MNFPLSFTNGLQKSASTGYIKDDLLAIKQRFKFHSIHLQHENMWSTQLRLLCTRVGKTVWQIKKEDTGSLLNPCENVDPEIGENRECFLFDEIRCYL